MLVKIKLKPTPIPRLFVLLLGIILVSACNFGPFPIEGGMAEPLPFIGESSSTIKYYTVKFLDFDGTVLDIQEIKHGSDASPPAEPVREGYSFVKWDKDCSFVSKNLTVKALFERSIIPVTDIIDVPAQYILNMPLELTGTVIPPNATSKDIVWRIKKANGSDATITGGLLNVKDPRDIVVTAIVEDTLPELDVASVSFNGSQYMARMTDDSLWSLSFDGYGYVRVGMDNDWSSVSIGGSHTIAIKIDGSLWT